MLVTFGVEDVCQKLLKRGRVPSVNYLTVIDLRLTMRVFIVTLMQNFGVHKSNRKELYQQIIQPAHTKRKQRIVPSDYQSIRQKDKDRHCETRKMDHTLNIRTTLVLDRHGNSQIETAEHTRFFRDRSCRHGPTQGWADETPTVRTTKGRPKGRNKEGEQNHKGI